MSRHDGYSSFRSTPARPHRRTAPRTPTHPTTPRLDLPASGAHSFVEIERQRHARGTGEVARGQARPKSPHARRGAAAGLRGGLLFGSSPAWEVVGWIAIATLLALAGVGALALVPGFLPAPAQLRSRGPVSTTAVAPDPGVPGTALLPGGGVPLPQQVAAPEVVALLAGDVADAWTLETIGEDTTLRVEVPSGRMGEAFMRASLALRTSEGRRAWSRLGADRLEIRSAGAAITLEVMSRPRP